jgi:hypothetical protein
MHATGHSGLSARLPGFGNGFTLRLFHRISIRYQVAIAYISLSIGGFGATERVFLPFPLPLPFPSA